MSAYDNDPRVRVWGGAVGTFDGPGGVAYAAVPDRRGTPTWWLVGPAVCPEGVNDVDVLPRFATLDEAIFSVIGGPQ